MAENAKDYSIAAAEKVLRVEDYLAQGEILEWRTVREVAEANQLSANEAHRCLHTLAKCRRVEQSGKGWRIHPEGLIRHAIYAQDYLNRQSDRLKGIRRPGQ
jgi:DNA-binding IclR family transcriptional regulator